MFAIPTSFNNNVGTRKQSGNQNLTLQLHNGTTLSNLSLSKISIDQNNNVTTQHLDADEAMDDMS